MGHIRVPHAPCYIICIIIHRILVAVYHVYLGQAFRMAASGMDM